MRFVICVVLHMIGKTTDAPNCAGAVTVRNSISGPVPDNSGYRRTEFLVSDYATSR